MEHYASRADSKKEERPETAELIQISMFAKHHYQNVRIRITPSIELTDREGVVTSSARDRINVPNSVPSDHEDNTHSSARIGNTRSGCPVE